MQFDDWYGRQNPDHIDELSARFAWEALMAEIRPLVADLRIMNPVEYSTDGPHNVATERLRELVREG